MNPFLVALGGFLLLVIIIVALRAKTGSKFDVKNSDIVLALIPIFLWLFLTGKVKEFAFGDLKITSAIEEASKTTVEEKVSKLPVETIRTEMKGGVGEIPDMLRRKVQALGFRIGHGGYWGPAIQSYLRELLTNPAFKYLIVYNPDGTFFGLADGRQVAAISGMNSSEAQTLADWLNRGQTTELPTLAGFISAKEALTNSSDTRTALQRMNAMDLQALPVVDEKGMLAGIVDRSKLSASMLIEIAQRVESGK